MFLTHAKVTSNESNINVGAVVYQDKYHSNSCKSYTKVVIQAFQTIRIKEQ